MSCLHMNFAVQANVYRITEDDGDKAKAYSVDLSVQCADCKESFVFLGMAGGVHPEKPMVSVMGEEARLPIRPSSEVNQPLPARKGATGFLVKNRS